MRALVSPPRSKPVWAFVEVGHPFSEADWPTIRPAEVQAAVWQSLIAGARGIIYFNHTFGGPNQTQHALRDPAYAAIRSAVSATNRRIAALAPVLERPDSQLRVGARDGYDGDGQVGERALLRVCRLRGIGCDRERSRYRAWATPAPPSWTRAALSRSTAGRSQIPSRTATRCTSTASTAGRPADCLRQRQPAPGARGPSGPGDLSRRTTARVGRLPRRLSLRSGRLVVPVRCAAACTVRSRLTMRRGSRRIKLAANKRRFGAGRRKLILRLSKRARHRVARAPRPVSLRLHTVIVQARGGGARRHAAPRRQATLRSFVTPLYRGGRRLRLWTTARLSPRYRWRRAAPRTARRER